MHAASVNPEPGSNSLKNCISTGEISSSDQHLFQSYFVLASFFTFSSFQSVLQRDLYTILCSFLFQNSSCCSIFKDRPPLRKKRFPSRSQPDYYTSLFFPCQPLFRNFSKIFINLWIFRKSALLCPCKPPRQNAGTCIFPFLPSAPAVFHAHININEENLAVLLCKKWRRCFGFAFFFQKLSNFPVIAGFLSVLIRKNMRKIHPFLHNYTIQFPDFSRGFFACVWRV